VILKTLFDWLAQKSSIHQQKFNAGPGWFIIVLGASKPTTSIMMLPTSEKAKNRTIGSLGYMKIRDTQNIICLGLSHRLNVSVCS